MLFEPIVRELVVFYVFLFRCIPQENYIFPNMSALFSLFLLLKKGSCKNRNETAKRLKWRIIFFSTNGSNKCFLTEACGKQVSEERRLLGAYGT